MSWFHYFSSNPKNKPAFNLSTLSTNTSNHTASDETGNDSYGSRLVHNFLLHFVFPLFNPYIEHPPALTQHLEPAKSLTHSDFSGTERLSQPFASPRLASLSHHPPGTEQSEFGLSTPILGCTDPTSLPRFSEATQKKYQPSRSPQIALPSSQLHTIRHLEYGTSTLER